MTKAKKPTQGIQQQRTIDFAIREINEDERRVNISFSSEQAVSRWFGSEILSHDAGCVILDRINSIGVALFNHKRDVVIGKIENARVDDTEKKTYADIVFDDDDESERIYKKVKSGTLKGISVGYSVDVWEEVMAGKISSNGRYTGPAYIATRWTPLEISVVSVPADDSVGVGRDLGEESINSIIEGVKSIMTNTKINPEVNPGERGIVIPATSVESSTNIESERQAAIKAERERVSGITTICRDFSINSEKVEKYINDGNTVEEVRAFVLQEMKERNKPSISGITVTKDESEKIREAASDAIIMRSGRSLEKPADGAREFRGLSLRDIAIDCLAREGVSNAQRLDNEELFKRALSPDSQFASILSSSVNKSMATAYSGNNTTFQAWTGRGSNTDFKDAEVYQISEAGELSKMSQTGEFKFDEMSDSKATKKIATFGKKFGITRQALINDDISILTRIPEAYVRAAGRGINKLVYSILTTNGSIYDNKALFHADHSNLASSGGAISVVTLGAGKAAMRKQKNLRGKETLNISPKFLLVSPDKEVEALQLLNSTADPSGSNAGVANVFRNSLDLVVDAELTGNAWYLAASALDIDTIEVTYLNGEDMPKLESRVGFDYLGMEWRIYIDYGVNVLDYRGLYKNVGN